MSGPTNKRFVRSAWTLLAFQFVAAAGATALAVWAAASVQDLLDQRDLLQRRVTELEARPAPAPPVAEEPIFEEPIVENAVVAPPPPLPPEIVPDRPGPRVVPDRPPREERNETVPPPRDPPKPAPTDTSPPRELPPVYIPPRYPVRPVRPPIRDPYPTPTTRPPPRQPVPGTIVRPTRPNENAPPATFAPGATAPIRPGAVSVRPVRPQGSAPAPAATQPASTLNPNDRRRARRPRTTDTEPVPPR